MSSSIQSKTTLPKRIFSQVEFLPKKQNATTEWRTKTNTPLGSKATPENMMLHPMVWFHNHPKRDTWTSIQAFSWAPPFTGKGYAIDREGSVYFTKLIFDEYIKCLDGGEGEA